MAKKLNTGPSIEEDILEEKRELRDRINAKRDELKREADQLTLEITELEATEGIAARVAAMPQAERDALFQELRANGIGSGEQFGKL